MTAADRMPSMRATPNVEAGQTPDPARIDGLE
jgi:hypothetical protein